MNWIERVGRAINLPHPLSCTLVRIVYGLKNTPSLALL